MSPAFLSGFIASFSGATVRRLDASSGESIPTVLRAYSANALSMCCTIDHGTTSYVMQNLSWRKKRTAFYRTHFLLTPSTPLLPSIPLVNAGECKVSGGGHRGVEGEATTKAASQFTRSFEA